MDTINLENVIVMRNVETLSIFARVFGYEFLSKNSDKIEFAIYTKEKYDFISIVYRYDVDRNLTFGFTNGQPNGCYIGHYNDEGAPVSSEHVFISFEDVDDVRSFIVNKFFELFRVRIDL